MTPFLPSRISLLDPRPDDPRIGHLLGRAVAAGARPRAALAGFPSDEGVRRNGGRPGAAEGPDAIRAALFRLTPDAEDAARFTEWVEHTVDLGNLEVSGDLERDQEGLGRALAPLLAEGVIPIVLGGGHETAFGHFLAYVELGRRVAILNWDAHPDVRPLLDGRAHSGSPFRQALTHPSGVCAGYTVAGLLPHAASEAHLRWVRERGGATVWRRGLTPERIDALYPEEGEPLLVSFDLDAVDAAWAPGVSAPATGGLDPERWLRAAYGAGRCARVASIDVVELNPRHDRDGHTARLAALTVWQFWKGLAERGAR